jgi:hypothetical protein
MYWLVEGVGLWLIFVLRPDAGCAWVDCGKGIIKTMMAFGNIAGHDNGHHTHLIVPLEIETDIDIT